MFFLRCAMCSIIYYCFYFKCFKLYFLNFIPNFPNNHNKLVMPIFIDQLFKPGLCTMNREEEDRKEPVLTRAVAVRQMLIYSRRRLQHYHRPNILVYAARPAYPWCRNVVFLGCPRKGFPNLWSWACCRWSLPLYLNVWLGCSMKIAPRKTIIPLAAF